MADYKILTYLFGAAFIIVLLLLLFGGKNTVFVCYDGTEQEDIKKCPANPLPLVTKKQAEMATTTFANAYALPKGDRASIYTTYYDKESVGYISEILFSSIKSQEVTKVTVSIDGRTSSIICIDGCEYLLSNSTKTNTTN